MKAIRKGMILKTKENVELKVIERADGFVKSKENCYWVRVTKNEFKNVKKGEEFTMTEKALRKLISKRII